jgi:hypothetical protein
MGWNMRHVFAFSKGILGSASGREFGARITISSATCPWMVRGILDCHFEYLPKRLTDLLSNSSRVYGIYPKQSVLESCVCYLGSFPWAVLSYRSFLRAGAGLDDAHQDWTRMLDLANYLSNFRGFVPWSGAFRASAPP